MLSDDTDQARGFAFEANSDAKVLILGSLPGVPSLKQQEYYANPRNAFWKIMGELFVSDEDISSFSYEKRLQVLRKHSVALWDVLAYAVRPGSLDSSIDTKSIILNDFESLFAYAPEISTIVFNGRTAEKLFTQHALLKKTALFANMDFVGMPSTSPAYAKMGFDRKLSEWSKIKNFVK